LLEASVLIASHLSEVGAARSRFAVHPGFAAQMSGSGWLACGAAALRFDPLCGEGTGHALREAILASAVLKAHAGGESWPEICALYEARLRAGFRRHLEQCLALYESGGTSAWWQEQADGLRNALAALPALRPPPSRYRLVDFDLLPA
jgi:flavin-dependent dehydrogenase